MGLPKFFGLGKKDIVGGYGINEKNAVDIGVDPLKKYSEKESVIIRLGLLEKKIRENSGKRHFTQKELENCLIELIQIVRWSL